MSRMKSQLEQINLRDAYNHVKEWISAGKEFDESLVLEVHQILMRDVFPDIGGRYRDIPVYISSATHDFPLPSKLPRLLNEYYESFKVRHQICGMPECMNAFQLAAWSHAEIVAIHPFRDGNGRLSRLLLNYVLLTQGFLPVYIPVQQRDVYYNMLDEYAKTRDYNKLADYIQKLEKNAVESEKNKIAKCCREHSNIIASNIGKREIASFDDLEP